MGRVYVLYTGGTIGCVTNPNGALAPVPGMEFEKLALSVPGLSDHRVKDYPDLGWTMDWFDRTLDSSNMTPADWVAIARRLLSVYDQYDGFVVLHGTDSMAYSASALSFLLPGLSKPVVFSGSQVPLSFTLSDAPANLVGAIVAAGTLPVPEVCVYFDTKLLRGNRSSKVDANRFAGFDSPTSRRSPPSAAWSPATSRIGCRCRTPASRWPSRTTGQSGWRRWTPCRRRWRPSPSSCCGSIPASAPARCRRC